MLLPFASGIAGHCIEKKGVLSLELNSLRNLSSKTFVTKDQTVIDTIKQGFSPILEDYLSDYLPGFSDAFLEMQSHSIPLPGEEREFKIHPRTTMKFCWIPAGEAQLGSPKEEQGYITKTFYHGKRPLWLDNEKESVRGIHKSNGFWLGKYPVTQAQWKDVVGNNPSNFNGDNLPVESVSWNKCQNFIKLCSISGIKLQLPHEDQWEYACRGGKGNKQPFYWGGVLNGDKANCDGNFPCGTDKQGAYPGETTEVGSYEKITPHPWNLCDMNGNVWEWCSNMWEYDGEDYRVVRGGGWLGSSWVCRSASRGRNQPSDHYDFIGFRLAIC